MYGAGYDLGDYEGDDMGELDGVMDVFNKEVLGVPVWGVLAGLAGLALFTKTGRKLVGLGGKSAKKNPRRKSRRRSRKALASVAAVKMNPRRRKNRRKSRRARR